MRRVRLLRAVGALALAMPLSASQQSGPATARPPNIVFILADDLGSADLYNRLKDDVGEQRNVAGANPEVVARLERYLTEAHVAPPTQQEPV